MNRFIHGVVGAAVLTLAAEGAAQADVTGYVSGKINLWNNNGNYCPAQGQGTCTGSRFPESQRGNQPFSNALIQLYDAADAFIGEGFSATDGTFVLRWTAPSRPAKIRMRFYAYHRDVRFYFTDTGGALYNWFTGLINTVANTTPTNPQPIGTTWSAGSSGSPSPYANAYWAAERLWRTVFNLVGVLQTNFTQIEIRGFADDIPGFLGKCTTSCASTNRVQLDANAGFKPQARVMHEMGHVATYKTHPWERAGNYNWPALAAGGGGWSQNGAEWGVSGFEEAFATHYGSIAFWGANATTPTTCNSTQSCYTVVVTPPSATPLTDTNIEATSFPFGTNNCSTAAANPESRWPLSHMRYFWDVFDSNNDATADTYSANAGDFWKHLHNLAWYPDGTAQSEIDEPWNDDYSVIAQRDGRGSASYRTNYGRNVVNTTGIRNANCTPP